MPTDLATKEPQSQYANIELKAIRTVSPSHHTWLGDGHKPGFLSKLTGTAAWTKSWETLQPIA